jgi:hypothetical protein
LNATIESGGVRSVQALNLKLDRSELEVSSDRRRELSSGTGQFNYTVNRRTAAVTAPDGIYPVEIVNDLSFTFEYTPAAPGRATGSVEAVLENPGIWQKTTGLLPPVSGDGPLLLKFAVDLGSIRGQFDEIDSQTKIVSSPRVVTLRATAGSANDTFVQSLRLVLDGEVLKVPGNLVLSLPAGNGRFDYRVNLKPNSLYSTATLQPPQPAASPGGEGSAGYDIELRPLPVPATGSPQPLAPGQTAFVKLIDRMDVTFSYEFKADRPVTDLNTDVRVAATIDAPQA